MNVLKALVDSPKSMLSSRVLDLLNEEPNYLQVVVNPDSFVDPMGSGQIVFTDPCGNETKCVFGDCLVVLGVILTEKG